MSLTRQLLLVSLLALLLPWAGCQFVRETESALRASQQRMLAGTAAAIADSFSQYADSFPPAAGNGAAVDEQIYAHELETIPVVDGYLEDWPLGESSLQTLGPGAVTARYLFGARDNSLFLFVSVTDPAVVYATPESLAPRDRPPYADRITLLSVTPPYEPEQLSFAAEAPGTIVPYSQNAFGFERDRMIRAVWQDVPGGYQVEARIPRSRLGTHLGLVVENVAAAGTPGSVAATWSSPRPPPFAGQSPVLDAVAAGLVQPGTRLLVTDRNGWRIAAAGSVQGASTAEPLGVSRWLRMAYDAVVDDGAPTSYAEPDAEGRERQEYVVNALAGTAGAGWFRSGDGSDAVVAVAQPVAADGGTIVGAVVLQQGTDAILSLTNRGLVRLMNVTLIALLLVGGGLLGYATWLSRRIRRLSIAAVQAVDDKRLGATLPSARSGDEIGDLSRSFSAVLGRVGAYNEYLRTLASKLSHELRTPLAIVTSSLENLEMESLDEVSRRYTARARDGAERLRRVLAAMSEASRVEELMNNVDTETFALDAAITSAVGAYRDIYPDRVFELTIDCAGECNVDGAPELVMQLLDKLVENAVSFSKEKDSIGIALHRDSDSVCVDVSNPGPPLPERMQDQLFDSMVSVRYNDDGAHLGLGLYVARLIAGGHNGRIEARNIDGGVRFSVWLPVAAHDSRNSRGGTRRGGSTRQGDAR